MEESLELTASPVTSVVSRRRHTLPLALLLITSVCLMLPVLLFGLPSNANDTAAHARWQMHFAAQFWAGDLYPRWLSAMNDGLGSPAFFIYPALPHYAAAWMAPLSDSASWAHHRVGVAATAAFFIGGVGTYFWLQEVTRDRVSALAGAVVFQLSPYHLFIDTYYRGAYAELWAFAWAPFSLLALHLFQNMPARALILYTMSTAALFASHAPSCIALPPLYIAYAILLSCNLRRKDILLWICAGSAVALMIAAAYLATALTHQNNINTSALYTGYFDFFRWLMLSGQPWPAQSIELGIMGTVAVQFGTLFVIATLVLRCRNVITMHRSLAWFAVAGSIVILFMMSAFSKPVWELVPLAQKIQFPWRLMTTQTLLLALGSALYVAWARSARTQLGFPWRRLYIPLLLVLFAANAGMFLYAQPAFDRQFTPEIRDVGEYRLGHVPKTAAIFEDGEHVRLIAGQGSVKSTRVGPRHVRVQIDASTPVRLILRQFHYPGWECTGASPAIRCSVRKFDTAPIVEVRAEPGRGHLDIVLGQSSQERAGVIVSAVGLFLLICLAFIAALLGRIDTKRRFSGTA